MRNVNVIVVTLCLVLFSVFSVVYAVGFHQTSEIVPGTFQGDYNFNGSVEITEKLNSLDFEDDGGMTINNTSADITINTDNGNRSLGLWTTSNGEGVIALHNSSSNRTVNLNGRGDSYFTSGNVGIGTNSPSAKLEVSGGETKLEQEGWNSVSFQNSWQNHGNSWAPAGYYKDSTGRVHLRGLINSGTLENCVFTLPSGYRPSYRKMFSATTQYNQGGTHHGACRIDVRTSGCVYIQNTCDSSWVSLEAISFRAENP